MADTFGALAFPVPAPSAGQAVGDPALDAITAYLAAVLTANLQTAWAASGVGDGQSIVKTVNKNSPEDGLFNKEDMPILFVWRGDSTNECITDDWVKKKTQVHVHWVTRPADQPKRAARSPIYNAVSSAIERALEQGRDPAWVDPADDDLEAATRGSVLMGRAGLFEWPILSSCKPYPVTIQIDESEARPYWSVLGMIDISEILEIDPATDAPAAATITVNQTDASTDPVTVGFSFEAKF